MKPHFLFTVLLCFGLKASAQNQFVLSGKITGVPVNSYVKIIYTDSKGGNVKDSALLVNDSFILKGDISEPTRANLIVKDKRIELFLEKGALTLNGNYPDVEHSKLTGSKTNDENLEFKVISEALSKEFKPVSDKINAVYAELRLAKLNKKSQATIDSLNDRLLVVGKEREPYAAKYEQAVHDFVVKHPHSFISPLQMGIYSTSWALNDMKAIFNSFSEEVKNSTQGKVIKKTITEREIQQAGLAKDFTAMSLDGRPLTLSSLKGKYVLLDFWGSWCVPCRAEMPHAKQLYNQYHKSGLEIVGVAVEQDKDKEGRWRRAVKQDGTGIWHNVLQKQDKKGEPGNITGLYNIGVYPTKVLIDKEGKIIGRYDGGGSDELDKKLAELFK
ncbi:redoxin domain-containing protein [Mucilaginibacter calamicampi]|uniref:Redoxin domain-containing protein n=1 Tax=Mucilaginibacter calamicampi TaxID=1302352 RepID=A0ABW2YR24_9SPHI